MKTINLDGINTPIQELIDGKVKITTRELISEYIIILDYHTCNFWAINSDGTKYSPNNLNRENWQTYVEPSKAMLPSERVNEIYEEITKAYTSGNDKISQELGNSMAFNAIKKYLDEEHKNREK